MAIRRQPPAQGTLSVSNTAAAVVLDFGRFVAPRGPASNASPIDSYYQEAARILTTTRQPWCTDQLLNLMLIDLVSCVERFVRDLLVGLVGCCPSAGVASDRKQVSLASLRYYADRERAYAAFDHQALSGVAEICKTTQGLVGVEVKQNSAAYAALKVFDSVCQLRHAIVHQGGRLAPHNLLELVTELPSAPVVVQLTPLLFEDLIAATHSAVRAYNQLLFEQTLARWFAEDVLTFNWSSDGPMFEAMVLLFHSLQDFPVVDPQAIYRSLGGVV